jgi:hypothetical protein
MYSLYLVRHNFHTVVFWILTLQSGKSELTRIYSLVFVVFGRGIFLQYVGSHTREAAEYHI